MADSNQLQNINIIVVPLEQLQSNIVNKENLMGLKIENQHRTFDNKILSAAS